MKKANLKSGFSLIELLVVVTLIAIVATLAITRLSGVQTKSAEVLNMANLSRIGPAIETYMVANERALNRLDVPMLNKIVDASKISGGGGGGGGGGGNQYEATLDNLLILNNPAVNTNAAAVAGNIGLAENLIRTMKMFGSTFGPMLSKYYLNDADVAALKGLGISHLMFFNDSDGGGMGSATGEDDEWATGVSTDPDTCLSIARTLERGMAVTVVNPVSMDMAGSRAPTGALVYQSCGQDVRFAYDGASAFWVTINGVNKGTDTAVVMPYLKQNGGILLAFGIGQYASFIGSTSSGLDSAPVCPVMAKDTYRRYFLLIRLQTVGGITKAQYAGVMDANGNTMKALRAASR